MISGANIIARKTIIRAIIYAMPAHLPAHLDILELSYALVAPLLVPVRSVLSQTTWREVIVSPMDSTKPMLIYNK